MKKVLSGLFVTALLLMSNPPFSFGIETVHAQKQIPSYAKWGIVAIKETMKKYPTSRIEDYSYMGKKTKDSKTEEKFKLWLKNYNNEDEFGVIVRIKYETKTEKVLEVKIDETRI
ncbi:DUF3889 domain-containing protein [Aquibacillus kalidii]|uniref:DUF3889 domain-containing protein n=1 Tax=Aquibacillus kalidii TaxID=2762597 RepID=UPI0016454F68|nr:DUF3889 domain-containing protein [Aquibacillus kalidii]